MYKKLYLYNHITTTLSLSFCFCPKKERKKYYNKQLSQNSFTNIISLYV